MRDGDGRCHSPHHPYHPTCLSTLNDKKKRKRRRRRANQTTCKQKTVTQELPIHFTVTPLLCHGMPNHIHPIKLGDVLLPLIQLWLISGGYGHGCHSDGQLLFHLHRRKVDNLILVCFPSEQQKEKLKLTNISSKLISFFFLFSFLRQKP